MKKAYRIILSLIFAACCLVTIVVFSKPCYSDVISDAKIVGYKSPDEVIEDSVLIVRVKKISEKAEAYPLENGLTDPFTLSTVVVQEVFKNDGHDTVQKGSEIVILESQWTDEVNKTIVHTSGYLKMEKGKEYLLLLGYNAPPTESYYPTGLLYGKIPVDTREKVWLEDGYETVREIVELLRKQYIR